MATEALKSLAITNRDATPRVPNSSYLEGGILLESVGFCEAGAGDTSSTYRMVQVPSNCRISQIMLFSDDVGASGAVDIGIYKTTADGGAVVDADFFASAVDVNTAALNGTDVTYEAGTAAGQIDDIEKRLWDQLGLTSDPGIMYDIVLTPSTALATGGSLSLRVRYVR
jgi:hypothetical protein